MQVSPESVRLRLPRFVRIWVAGMQLEVSPTVTPDRYIDVLREAERRIESGGELALMTPGVDLSVVTTKGACRIVRESYREESVKKPKFRSATLRRRSMK